MFISSWASRPTRGKTAHAWEHNTLLKNKHAKAQFEKRSPAVVSFVQQAPDRTAG